MLAVFRWRQGGFAFAAARGKMEGMPDSSPALHLRSDTAHRGAGRRVSSRAAVIAALALLTVVATAAELPPGAAMPDFAKLRSADGKSYSLADFADSQVLVVVFTGNTCPVAQSYLERMNEFAVEYRPQGVRLLAVNSDRDPAESLAAMQTLVKQEKLEFLYLKDHDQQFARGCGATVTPHVFIFDRQRKLAYRGAWDDRWQNPQTVTAPYVRQAVEALLAGKQPPVTRTQQIGCGIEFE